MVVQKVEKWTGQDVVSFGCQYSDNPEDNTFSQATPSGDMKLTISNPALIGTFNPGDQFFVDLTKIEK